MSLIKCHECDAEISENAEYCPNCGLPMYNLIRCSECGKMSTKDKTSCPSCGCPFYSRYQKPLYLNQSFPFNNPQQQLSQRMLGQPNSMDLTNLNYQHYQELNQNNKSWNPVDRFSNKREALPNNKGILTLGILSLVFSLFLGGIIGLILGLIGLSMANSSKALYTENPDQYSNYDNVKAGYIMSLIGTIIGALYLLAMIVLIVFLRYTIQNIVNIF